MIKFWDSKKIPQKLIDNWQVKVSEVIKAGQFIGGPYVDEFEQNWGKYLDSKHVIGVGNGYDALYIALKSIRIGEGDFVAVPNHTFIATWLAVDATGATPIGVDVTKNGLMDIGLLKKIDLKFSAVIPVHMHGQMVDMPELIGWANDRNVFVIEDCAQSHGSSLLGKKAGTWGDIGVYSFYPTKNLGAIGDGGAINTNNDYLAEVIRSLANYGKNPSSVFNYERIGVNSRLDPIQAAVLSCNLSHLDAWNSSRAKLAAIYFDFLDNNGIESISRPKNNVFHHFTCRTNNRSLTKKLMYQSGLEVGIHYNSSAYRLYHEIKKNIPLTQSIAAEKIALETISLPMSPWLSEDDISEILFIISQPNILQSFF